MFTLTPHFILHILQRFKKSCQITSENPFDVNKGKFDFNQ